MRKPCYTVFRTCGGCANAVTRILNKFDGVTDVNCDVGQKTVTVQHHSDSVASADMLDALMQWRY